MVAKLTARRDHAIHAALIATSEQRHEDARSYLERALKAAKELESWR